MKNGSRKTAAAWTNLDLFREPPLNSPISPLPAATPGAFGSASSETSRVPVPRRRKRPRRIPDTRADTTKVLLETIERLEDVRCERYMLQQLARMEYCVKCTPEQLDASIIGGIEWYDHSMVPKKYIEF